MGFNSGFKGLTGVCYTGNCVLCEMRALSFSATEKIFCPKDSHVYHGDLCGTKRHWKRFSLGYFGLVFRYHSTSAAHTHISAAVIRRTSVPNLKSPNKAIALPQIKRIAKKVKFILRKVYRFLQSYITSKLITLRSVLFI